MPSASTREIVNEFGGTYNLRRLGQFLGATVIAPQLSSLSTGIAGCLFVVPSHTFLLRSCLFGANHNVWPLLWRGHLPRVQTTRVCDYNPHRDSVLIIAMALSSDTLSCCRLLTNNHKFISFAANAFGLLPAIAAAARSIHFHFAAVLVNPGPFVISYEKFLGLLPRGGDFQPGPPRNYWYPGSA